MDPKYKSIKKLFSAMESDNNPNVIHSPVNDSIHQGESAIGELGLMPETIRTQAFRRIRDNQATPADYLLKDADEEQMSQFLKDNPHKYDEYANQLINKVSQKAKGNPTDAYLMWRYGDKISNDKLKQIKQSKPELLNTINRRIYENNLSSEIPEFTEKLPQVNEKDILFSKIKDRVK